jgi:nucleotide-binding universal stress UspA family protein
MFSRILVPLDGSALVEVSLRHAAKLARAFDARVLLLWVTDAEPAAGGPDHERWSVARSEARAQLSRLTQLFQSLAISVDTRIASGDMAERTLEAAADETADVIVLSTHHWTGRTRFPLSGTASKILAAARDSMLVVPSQEELATLIDTPYRTIVAAVDLTDHSRRSAAVAAEIARAEGAELLLLTVIEIPEVLGADPGGERASLVQRLVQLSRDRVQGELDELRASLDADLRAGTLVIDARDVAIAVEELARSKGASLLVLAARGCKENVDRPQGAVASRLLERVSCPVLLFRERAPISAAELPELPALAAQTTQGD